MARFSWSDLVRTWHSLHYQQPGQTKNFSRLNTAMVSDVLLWCYYKETNYLFCVNWKIKVYIWTLSPKRLIHWNTKNKNKNNGLCTFGLHFNLKIEESEEENCHVKLVEASKKVNQQISTKNLEHFPSPSISLFLVYKWNPTFIIKLLLYRCKNIISRHRKH